MGSEKTIAVVSALSEELDYLFDKTELDWGPLCDLDDLLQVRKCVVNNCEIVATHASGKMGLTETAILTTRIILGCQPDFIAMIGVCGGFKERGVNIGDVIVAEKSFHYQFGSFKDKSIQPELKVCEVKHRFFSKLTEFLNTTKMSEIQNSSPRGMKKSDKILKVWCGPMASADLVVKDKDKLAEAQAAERKVIAVDMESYAFLRSSELLGVDSVVIKSVSDFADSDKGKDDDLREYAKYNSSETLLEFIKHNFFLTVTNNEGYNRNSDPIKSYLNTDFNKISIGKAPTKKSFMDDIISDMETIPLGCFSIEDAKMGSQKIQIKDSFKVGKFLVTQSLYQKVMDNNPSHFKGDNRPVEHTSWFDAIEFCNKLSSMIGLDKIYEYSEKGVCIKYDKNGFRLPTEVEWEYACRANSIDDPYGELDEISWYKNNANSRTHIVGQKHPNGFGLFDMLGNVWEWCNNWFTKNYINENPIGPENGMERVLRGGSWSDFSLNNIRASARSRKDPSYKDDNIGFRIVLNLTTDSLNRKR